MKKYIVLLLLFSSFCVFPQDYEFTPIVDLEATDVISQGNTGTCWSFSTTSFLESEIIRITGKHMDLSEMYSVRHTYSKKAWNYVMRQGNAQFSQGALAHDVINSAMGYGLVPEAVYSGLKQGETKHNHSELISSLKKVLDSYISKKSKDSSNEWKEEFETILDTSLGKNIEHFNFEGVQYTPKSFMEMTQIHPSDYVTITSFTHEPYYSSFILSIPDNFSNGTFYYVSLEEMIATIKHALENGYTVELDCYVSEKSFMPKNGVAIIPEDMEKIKDASKHSVSEKQITPEYRQQEFENFHTTDDHLMHITGLVKDQNGTLYFKVKNSWGSDSSRVAYGGYIYMSESYIRLKTISILVHKEAVPEETRIKLGL